MLIDCPYCGARDSHEFSYRGDAASTRPDPTAEKAAEAFHDYVYLRDNPAGDHLGWWYHGAGCRQWLKVSRNTLTHTINAVRLARDEVKS
jgi:methylglutamate dehydrogenase subunit B